MSKEIRCKIKIITQLFPKKGSTSENSYRIFGCVLTERNDEVTLNNYSNFSISGDLSYLSVNKEYEIIIKEDAKSNYPASYVVVSCPSLEELDIENLTYEASLEIMQTFTTEKQSKEVLSKYPNFISMVLNNEEDKIDVNNLYNIKEFRLNYYVSEIKNKYKYFHILTSNKEFDLSISECKKLESIFKTIDAIKEELNTKPYRALIRICERDFENSDKIIISLFPELRDSDERAEYLMLFILAKNEYDANTKINASIMARYCREIAPEVLSKLKTVAVDSELIYYDNDTNDIAIQSTYVAEAYIADKVKTLLREPNNLNIDWKKYQKTDEYEMTDEQTELLHIANDYNIGILRGGAGCVDCDTEYFNGTKWVKISEYKDGDNVLQYHKDGHTSLTKPSKYHKYPCFEMIHIETEELDQMLSIDHTVVYKDFMEKEYKEEQLANLILFNKYIYLPYYENEDFYDKKVSYRKLNTLRGLKRAVPKDGFKYCFTVDTHMLVLRRNNKIFITGNCGKSTSVKALINMLEDNHLTYTLVSFTGVASKRLAEATNRKASTIHRATSSGREINTDFLICDEYSVCGIELTVMMMKAMNTNTKLLLICDEMQFSSIQCGNCLKDMIDSNLIPMAILSKVFRYGIGSLTTVATDIRNGVPHIGLDGIPCFTNWEKDNSYEFILIDNEDPLEQVLDAYRRLLKKYTYKEIQVLSSYNIGSVGTYAINSAIQDEFNPLKPRQNQASYKRGKTPINFRVGDKVLNTVNTYDCLTLEQFEQHKKAKLLVLSDDEVEEDVGERRTVVDIVNGDVGYIRDIDIEGNIIVQIDEEMVVFTKQTIKNLLLGYSVSFIKSQGSQNKAIITIVHKSHGKYLNRSSVYVANTRAQEKLIEISDVKTVRDALEVVEINNRETFLGNLLQDTRKGEIK